MTPQAQPQAAHGAAPAAAGHANMMSETGKHFYSWQTIASLTGTTAAVTMIWSVLGDVAGTAYASKISLLLISVIVVAALALFTEPPRGAHQASSKAKGRWKSVGQKTVQAAINSCLVYMTATGTLQFVEGPKV